MAGVKAKVIGGRVVGWGAASVLDIQSFFIKEY